MRSSVECKSIFLLFRSKNVTERLLLCCQLFLRQCRLLHKIGSHQNLAFQYWLAIEHEWDMNGQRPALFFFFFFFNGLKRGDGGGSHDKAATTSIFTSGRWWWWGQKHIFDLTHSPNETWYGYMGIMRLRRSSQQQSLLEDFASARWLVYDSGCCIK